MAKKDANYSMDDVSSVDCSSTPAGMEGKYPTGKGDTEMDGVISVDTAVELTHDSSGIFAENFGPPVPMDAVTELPGAKRPKPFYSGNGSGTIGPKPPGFDDF